jgi:uncharacterized protein (TIGR02246 family)
VTDLRPTLSTPGADDEAVAVAARFVAELQQGIDEHDAVVYNRHFAVDVAWGGPFGAVVRGFEPLHAIHQRLQATRAGGPASLYEVISVVAPTEDVVLAHVARRTLDAAGEPLPPLADDTHPFSEMALYVLVHRDGNWWLAAGQNTPIRPGGAAPNS